MGPRQTPAAKRTRRVAASVILRYSVLLFLLCWIAVTTWLTIVG